MGGRQATEKAGIVSALGHSMGSSGKTKTSSKGRTEETLWKASVSQNLGCHNRNNTLRKRPETEV